LRIISDQNQGSISLASAQDYLSRLHRLQREMQRVDLDGCLIEHPLDLYYFIGLKLSAGKLWISAKQILLLVDGRYLQIAKEKSPVPCFLNTEEQSVLFCQNQGLRKIGFDGQHTCYDHFLYLEQLQKEASLGATLISSALLFKRIRSIKDAGEISKIRKSATLLWKGFQYIRSCLVEGITEKQLSRAFEIFSLQNGADSLSFDPIIAFGPNAAMPHHRSQNTPLKEADAVLIDIGVACDSYHSDMTRVLFFKKEDPYIRQLYEIVKRAQQSALGVCRPGATFKEVDLAARQVLKQENVEELFTHSLGHGIGLAVHEFPRIKFDGEDKDAVLEKGMVFTLEPGLYVPGIGGVRYEDTIAITEEGYENFYPDETYT
jgi:Xaa-Pro aminopeptidase